MKRAFASLAGLVALGRWLSQRRHPAPTVPEPVETPADDPAEELRRKLASARQPGPDIATEPAAREETLEERRARVHAKAREAIDAMGDDGAVT